MNKNDPTKERILKVSNKLFAKKGFAGTSVREIAQKAEVNLAAINYHFENKENLYWSVFAYNHNYLETQIDKLGMESRTTEDLTKAVFEFFYKEKMAIMNTFKIFLSDNINIPDGDLGSESLDRFAPPGQNVFLEKIRNDLGADYSEDAAHWILKTIFTQLIHFTVVMNTKYAESKRKKGLGLEYDTVLEMLIHSVRSYFFYLKNNEFTLNLPKTS